VAERVPAEAVLALGWAAVLARELAQVQVQVQVRAWVQALGPEAESALVASPRVLHRPSRHNS